MKASSGTGAKALLVMMRYSLHLVDEALQDQLRWPNEGQGRILGAQISEFPVYIGCFDRNSCIFRSISI